MKTSAAGLEALTQREGVRYHAYQDVRGIWTIGVGHTAMAGPPHPYPGLVITPEECQIILARDVGPCENEINALVKVPMTQNQFDALVSLTFNIGIGGFRGSSVLRQLNAKQYVVAADDFLMWDHPPQLIGRRRAERAQFLAA
jgi:lysozyme